MKKLLIPFIGFALLGCTDLDKSPATESQRVETVEKPDIETQTPESIQISDSAYLKDKKPITETVEQDSLIIADPHHTIKRIFDTYNQYQESTDSPANIDSLKQSLKILERSDIDQEVLTLVINVWMYYTVTDFRTLNYTENVLRAHKEESIEAIKNRIKNKKDWESTSSAPYSELPNLLARIENE